MAVKMKASDKRFAAIKAFADKTRPESNGYRLLLTITPEEMISDIEAMRTLGRTARWQETLTQWQAMIREDVEMNGNADWASLQGSVYAVYAAE
jgi:hypothetical protein